MSNQCEHGQLARVCEICELRAELTALRERAKLALGAYEANVNAALKLKDERDALREDAERYRWLRDNAKEELLYPARAGGEVPDLRTKWSMPTLICSSCIGGYMSFDESIDTARGKE